MRSTQSCLTLLWFMLVPAIAQADPLNLRGHSDEYALDQHVEFWVDTSDSLGFDQVIDESNGPEFVPLPGKATFGFADGTHWFRAQLHNQDHPAQQWLMVIEYSLLDEVDVWILQDDGEVQRFEVGDRRPFSARSFKHRHFNFLFELPEGRNAELVVRVKSTSSIQVPMRIYSRMAFAAANHESQLGIGIYYGILIGLLLYNLILFVSVRDINYFYYVLYVTCFGLVQLALNGLSFEYLWPNSPYWANVSVPVFMTLGVISMAQFSRSFLDLKNNFPAGNRLFIFCMFFQAAMFVGAWFLPYRPVVVIETAFIFFMAALIVYCGVGCLMRGYRPAAYFLLAWSFVLSGAVIYAMVSFDLLPKNFFTEYGMQIGSAAEMILLSFALAYRINLLTRENEVMAREAAELLEYRVEVRTRELNSALAELEDANRRLEQHSHQDGLTGVHNRRYLDDAMEQMWQQARQEGHPLSLLILDLDHFKKVNDEFGHLVGDDVLCSVARLLTDSVRGSEDVVARYGGEEFFVVMAGAHEDDAYRRAEELRRRIESLDIKVSGRTLKPTVSIGVATIRPAGSATVRELMRRADAALYRAKDDGRNRVIAA